ncbi:MAG: hypothetical protein RLZZ373_3183 [Pseudomonadota bacterium]|jgi:hypothetical protein
MLTQVPAAISSASRLVVLRHPNSFPCSVWRKVFTRTEIDPATGQPGTLGGMPTLGGMEVLTGTDEAEFEYQPLGDGRAMFLGRYQPDDLLERGNATLQQVEQRALVESLAEPGDAGSFAVQTGDLVAILPGMGVVLAFSVERRNGVIGIPGYPSEVILSPRDELDQLTPFMPGDIVPVE